MPPRLTDSTEKKLDSIQQLIIVGVICGAAAALGLALGKWQSSRQIRLVFEDRFGNQVAAALTPNTPPSERDDRLRAVVLELKGCNGQHMKRGERQ